MKRLLLEEDDSFLAGSTDEEQIMTSTMINALIKGEWDAIDQYSGMIANLDPEKDAEILDVLNEIISEEYVHVGQLEKLAQGVMPVADNILVGHEHDETSEGDSEE